MKRQRGVAVYVVGDVLATALAWTLFYFLRKHLIEEKLIRITHGFEDERLIIALLVIPAFWVGLYALIGTYQRIYRKSRVRELFITLVATFLGSVLLFFLLLLDDEVKSYVDYRRSFGLLFGLQSACLLLWRISYLTRIKTKLKNRRLGYNTLLVGDNPESRKLFDELDNEPYSQGYRFVGYVALSHEPGGSINGFLPHLGSEEDVVDVIRRQKVEEVIIASEVKRDGAVNALLDRLAPEDVFIKVLPDMRDILTGSVRMNYIFGTALIQIDPEIMPAWQRNIKWLMDKIGAFIFLLLFAPLYFVLALMVRFSSPGPIFFSQKRVGLHGRPFDIYKFRTMRTDAEKFGPALSSDNDPRITPVGKFLRKYRLDELPQFYNVLKGDMSLVGPRPERQFFIDQIVDTAPEYLQLQKVKPGITSWGQIKFGYAENVDQMVERLKFDILYIENMSLAMDLKILFYTILIILRGSGK